MKPNKLTPGSNILWESSRMFLPEHREQLLHHQKEKTKLKRPLLDDQQLEEMAFTLQHAYKEKYQVQVTEFDSFNSHIYIGCITNIDPQLQQFKLEDENGEIKWIKFTDLLGIETNFQYSD